MHKRALAISAACILSANVLWACEDDGNNSTESSNTTAPDDSSAVSTNTQTGGTNTAGGAAPTGPSNTNTAPGTDGNQTANSENAGAIQLDDAQIASIAVTANQGEVEQNKVALERAQREDARAFAQDMVTMHSAALARATALAMTLKLTPEDNTISQTLRKESETIVANLKGVEQAEFDQMYLQSQVDVHQQVLTLIDTDLLSNVDAAQLRDELTAMRETVAMHLEHARALVSGSQH